MEEPKLIPRQDIRPEIRRLVIARAESNGYDFIGDEHKLASDIQNLIDSELSIIRRAYEHANKQNIAMSKENKELRQSISEIQELISGLANLNDKGGFDI